MSGRCLIFIVRDTITKAVGGALTRPFAGRKDRGAAECPAHRKMTFQFVKQLQINLAKIISGFTPDGTGVGAVGL
jgi:hypothetical protein